MLTTLGPWIFEIFLQSANILQAFEQSFCLLSSLVSHAFASTTARADAPILQSGSLHPYAKVRHAQWNNQMARLHQLYHLCSACTRKQLAMALDRLDWHSQESLTMNSTSLRELAA